MTAHHGHSQRQNGSWANRVRAPILTGSMVLAVTMSLVALLGETRIASAATITVTTPLDLGSGSECSLRSAIFAANYDTVGDGCNAGAGADTILLAATTYSLTYGRLTIEAGSQIAIHGVTSDTTLIDGNREAAIFVNYGSLELDQLHLTHGMGGCIYNDTDAWLTATHMIVSDCAISNTVTAIGAAFHNQGSALLSDVQLVSNTALTLYHYDVLWCGDDCKLGEPTGGRPTEPELPMRLAASPESAHQADLQCKSLGGAIYNIAWGNIVLRGVMVAGNTASAHSEPMPYTGCQARGGGVYNLGHMEIYGSVFAGNAALGTHDQYGGAIENQGDMEIDGSSITGNRQHTVVAGQGAGGGVHNSGRLLIRNSVLTGNVGVVGGALSNAAAGEMQLVRTIIEGNSAYGPAAGVMNWGILTGTELIVAGNGASMTMPVFGGGVANTGRAWIDRGSVVSNSLYSGAAGHAGIAYGGGVYNSGDLVLSNVTLSGNAAGGDEWLGLPPSVSGGGIFNEGQLTATHITVSQNQVVISDSAIYNDTPGQLWVRNSILMGQCAGTVSSDVGNVTDGTSGCPGVTHTLTLSPAMNYGGFVPTQALPPGSAAIDAAATVYCSAIDARGYRRLPFACDSGAYEAEPALAVYVPLLRRIDG